MPDNNQHPFARAFQPGGNTPAPEPREDRRNWDAPPPEPVIEQPGFLGVGSVSTPPGAPGTPIIDAPTPKPTKKQAKAERKADATKPPRRDRKAERRAADVRKKAVENKKHIPLGQRYGGDRRKHLLLLGALLLSPVLSMLAFTISSTKASEADVKAAVAEALKDQGAEFPSGQAVMWAGQVVRIWGTWDEADETGQRDVLMSQFLSRGLSNTAGWNEQGKQEVLYSTVNPQPTITDENHAWVDASYQIQDGTWRCVSLPVYAYHPESFTQEDSYAFALSANPVPVACAPRTGAPAIPATTAPDGSSFEDASTEAQDLASTFMPGFFAAWSASDQATLRQYAISDAQLIGLGGAFESTPAPTIESVALPVASNASVESGQSYVATVTVTWTVAGSTAQLTASYDVDLAREGSQWFVKGEPTPVMQDSRVTDGEAGDLAPGTSGDRANLWSTPSPKAPASDDEVAPTSADR